MTDSERYRQALYRYWLAPKGEKLKRLAELQKLNRELLEKDLADRWERAA